MKENRAVWEKIFEEKEWGKYPPIPLVRFVAKKFYTYKPRENIKFLELGCGTGANLWYLAREGFSVSGIDFSENAIKRLTDRFKKESLLERVENLFVGDYLEEIEKFEDEYFSCILDIESLICNDQETVKKIIQKVYSKLKKDGFFFSMHFEYGSYGQESAIFDSEKGMYIFTEGPLKDTGYVRLLKVEDIQDLYLQYGFVIEFIHRDIYQYDIYSEDKSIKELIICLRKK